MQKGKTEKEYTMTQAVTNFYLFINKRYGNDDFQTIKNAMERTGDDVISYGEVRGFIDENKTQQWGDVFLKNIDVSGVNAIWNELDKTRRGFNSSATLQVSENGSLNATEEQAMENKIALYGRIDDALNKVITSDVIAVLQGLGINENELYYEAANLIAGLGNINNMNENELLELAKEKVKEAAKNVIKEAQFKNSEYTEQLKTANLGDYDLKNDEDLNSLIDTRLNQLIAGGEDLKTLLQHMNSSVKAIIRGYIGSANIGWYDDPSFQAQLSEQGVLQWPDSNNLNKLQLERLKQTCKDKLKPESFNGFDGFTDVLQAAIDKFIETKEASWANIKSGNFDNTLSALSGIKTEFENSPQFKALGYVINMTKADSEFVTERLAWIGLNKETVDVLIKKPQFKQYIKDAYNAIMANPEGYGINNNNDLANETKINQAVMKYIQDNMDKILEETGCVKVGENRKTKEEQTAAILYWNFYSAKTWQDNGDSHYENDDLYNYALMFVNYVLTAYAQNDYVKEALEETELEMLPSYKDEWSPGEIKEKMDIVMKAIQDHPKAKETKTDGSGNGGPDPDPIIEDDMTKAKFRLQPGIKRGDNRYCDIDEVKQEAKRTLADLLSYITADKLPDYDAKKISTAKNNVKAYYEAIIDALKKTDDTHNTTRSVEVDVDGEKTDYCYSYYGDGNYTYEDRLESGALEQGKNQGSTSGVYFLEIARTWPARNSYNVCFDRNVVWQKFCDFYNAL